MVPARLRCDFAARFAHELPTKTRDPNGRVRVLPLSSLRPDKYGEATIGVGYPRHDRVEERPFLFIPPDTTLTGIEIIGLRSSVELD